VKVADGPGVENERAGGRRQKTGVNLGLDPPGQLSEGEINFAVGKQTVQTGDVRRERPT